MKNEGRNAILTPKQNSYRTIKIELLQECENGCLLSDQPIKKTAACNAA